MPYIGVSPQFGVRRKHTYTATAGQTSFSGAGSEGATLSYRDSTFVDVYQNGVKLGDADYTSTSGTAIVLAQGASVSDIVEIVVFDVFSVADTVSKADGGTFDGNVTAAGTLAVTGASTLTGALSAKGGAVFNEDSADVDFRVESDVSGDTHALFVEGSSGNVGIFTSSGLSALSTDARMLQINGSYLTHFDNDASGTTSLSNNMFFDGSNNKSLYTGQASQYYQNIGEHYFRTAPSNGANATLSPVTVMKIDNTGAVTKPLQPAFLVKASGGQQNIAINTMTEVQWNGGEIFDQSDDFASHTFTAPVTGKYQINAHMYLNSVDTAANYYQLQITTSNRSYTMVFTPNFSSDLTYYQMTLAMLVDMDASDTATINVYQSAGTAQLDIDGASYFSGYLVC